MDNRIITPSPGDNADRFSGDGEDSEWAGNEDLPVPEPSFPVSPRRVWWGGILSLLIGLGGLVVVFLISGRELSWHNLTFFPGRYGLVALGLLGVGWLADSLRWWLLIAALGCRLPVRDLLRIVFAGYFMSCVTPFVSGGEPVQIYAMTRHGLTVGQGTAVVVASGLINQLVLAMGALVATVTTDFTHHALVPWTDLAVYLYLVGLSLYLVVVLNTEWFLREGQALGGRLGLRGAWRSERGIWIRQKLLRASADFHQALRLLCRRPAPLVLGCLSTILFYFLFFSLAPILLLGLGIRVPFWQVQALQVVFWLLFSFMPTPGGSGMAEVGFVAVLAGVVPTATLYPLAMSWRLLTFYLRLLLGWPCFVATLKGGWKAWGRKGLPTGAENKKIMVGEKES